jgi:hypothetical protein
MPSFIEKNNRASLRVMVVFGKPEFAMTSCVRPRLGLNAITKTVKASMVIHCGQWIKLLAIR